MKIENLKDLSKLIQLCQKQGIQSIKVDGIELTLGAPPLTSGKKKTTKSTTYAPGGITDDVKITTDELTPEQLLMWSTGEAAQPGELS